MLRAPRDGQHEVAAAVWQALGLNRSMLTDAGPFRGDSVRTLIGMTGHGQRQMRTFALLGRVAKSGR
jgi:hypothetical protein